MSCDCLAARSLKARHPVFLRKLFWNLAVSIPNKVWGSSSKQAVQVQEQRMRSNKAWYWLTAGVLALGLNGAYQDGQLGWAHVLANRAARVVQRASLRGHHFLTM